MNANKSESTAEEEYCLLIDRVCSSNVDCAPRQLAERRRECVGICAPLTRFCFRVCFRRLSLWSAIRKVSESLNENNIIETWFAF